MDTLDFHIHHSPILFPSFLPEGRNSHPEFCLSLLCMYVLKIILVRLYLFLRYTNWHFYNYINALCCKYMYIYIYLILHSFLLSVMLL